MSNAFKFGIYIDEISNQLQISLACIVQFNRALNPNAQSEGPLNHFFWLQTAIMHAAASSYYFHPSRTNSKTKRRARVLKSIYAADQAIGYISNRSMRDHLVHLDERFEHWWDNSTNHNIVRHLTGPRNSIGGNAIGPQDIFEQYIPHQRILIFRGQEQNIQELVDHIVTLHNRSQSLSQMRRQSRTEFEDLIESAIS